MVVGAAALAIACTAPLALCVTATNKLMAAVVVATATAADTSKLMLLLLLMVLLLLIPYHLCYCCCYKTGITATTARHGGGPDLMGNIELEYIIGINGVIVIGIH